MSSIEKDTSSDKIAVGRPANAAYLINERRRAALAEIDNAKLS
jgi:hypothetical protein